MKKINFDTFLTRTIKAWAPTIMENLNRQRHMVAELFSPYKGLPGPVTFHGSPRECVQKLRRWQTGIRVTTQPE